MQEVDAAIQLALTFKTSPMPFLDLPSHGLALLLSRTRAVVDEAERSRDDG